MESNTAFLWIKPYQGFFPSQLEKKSVTDPLFLRLDISIFVGISHSKQTKKLAS